MNTHAQSITDATSAALSRWQATRPCPTGRARAFDISEIAYTVEETGRDIGIGAGLGGGVDRQWPPPWGQPLRQALRRVRRG